MPTDADEELVADGFFAARRGVVLEAERWGDRGVVAIRTAGGQRRLFGVYQFDRLLAGAGVTSAAELVGRDLDLVACLIGGR